MAASCRRVHRHRTGRVCSCAYEVVYERAAVHGGAALNGRKTYAIVRCANVRLRTAAPLAPLDEWPIEFIVADDAIYSS